MLQLSWQQGRTHCNWYSKVTATRTQLTTYKMSLTCLCTSRNFTGHNKSCHGVVKVNLPCGARLISRAQFHWGFDFQQCNDFHSGLHQQFYSCLACKEPQLDRYVSLNQLTALIRELAHNITLQIHVWAARARPSCLQTFKLALTWHTHVMWRHVTYVSPLNLAGLCANGNGESDKGPVPLFCRYVTEHPLSYPHHISSPHTDQLC